MTWQPWSSDTSENQKLIDELLSAPPGYPPVSQGVPDGKFQAFSRNADGSWNFGHPGAAAEGATPQGAAGAAVESTPSDASRVRPADYPQIPEASAPEASAAPPEASAAPESVELPAAVEAAAEDPARLSVPTPESGQEAAPAA